MNLKKLRALEDIAHHPVNAFYFVYDQISRPNDCLLVTMQSSGTHWLRFMIAKALVDYYKLDYEFTNVHPDPVVPPFGLRCHQVFLYDAHTNIPRVQHTHQFYEFPHRAFFRQKKVIMLVRDLRDALASHYDKMRRGGSSLSFEEFLKDDQLMKRKSMHGSLGGRVQFLNSWGKALSKLEHHIVYYERLQEDPHLELSKVLSFLRIEPSPSLVEEVVRFSSLPNMQSIGQRAAVCGDADNPKKEVHAVNRGRVGSHRDLFGEEEERYFLQYVKEHLDHDFGYHYK